MAKSMSRTQFLQAVADKAGAHKRDVEHVWETALGVISDSVKKGQAVSITGFGKFSQRVRKARPAGMARNPFTGEERRVPARPKTAVPRFAPAKQFKEYVGGSLKAMPGRATKPMALATAAPAGKAAPKKAAKKTVAKKSAGKKTAGKKTAAKKTAAKKTAAKKPAARKGAKRR